MDRLSERDRAVVNMIFDPLASLGFAEFSSESPEVSPESSDELPDNIKAIVKKAISTAEEKNFDESFRLFDEAITLVPDSPSILNDRAQALRLAGKDEEALEVLNRAVELSAGAGKAGVQALCQRGVLYRSRGEDDKAREDFGLAAKGGSSFARSQLVALNPYAAMCNAMLREITVNSAGCR